MNQSNRNYGWKSVAALAVLLMALPTFADKRRAARTPSRGPALQTALSGTVTDSVTGLPVVFATVRLAGGRSDRTDKQGKYNFNTVVYGSGVLSVERTGYETNSREINGGGDQVVNLTVKPTPTVRVRMVNSAVYDVDYESAEFGYVIPFGSYSSSTYDDFCTANGTATRHDRSTMKRIIGPATPSTVTACCTARDVSKVSIEFKTGETTDLFFADSCYYGIDFIARDHVGGELRYLRFTEIGEIVFP